MGFLSGFSKVECEENYGLNDKSVCAIYTKEIQMYLSVSDNTKIIYWIIQP